MAFKYQEIAPWGRSFNEYCRMFDLTAENLRRRILGCADGPASFNAEMSRQGHRAISCDPLYSPTSGQIRTRIDASYEEVIRQARQNEDKFIWDQITPLSPSFTSGTRSERDLHHQ